MNKRSVIDGEDDEDVPIELSTLIVTEIEKENLPTGYKSLGNGIVYDEAWDETVELLIIDEAEDGQLGKSNVEESEIEERVGWKKVNWKVVKWEKVRTQRVIQKKMGLRRVITLKTVTRC